MKRVWVIHSWPRYWLVWPWWGGWMYRIVTGVTSDVGVPSTYLVMIVMLQSFPDGWNFCKQFHYVAEWYLPGIMSEILKNYYYHSFLYAFRSSWSPPHAKYRPDVYRNQPRSITDYEPGFSSIAFREARTVSFRSLCYEDIGVICFWSCTGKWGLSGIPRWEKNIFDGLVQERRNSIANVLELHLSCTNLSYWWLSARLQ